MDIFKTRMNEKKEKGFTWYVIYSFQTFWRESKQNEDNSFNLLLQTVLFVFCHNWNNFNFNKETLFKNKMEKIRGTCCYLEGAGQKQKTQQMASLTHDQEAKGKNKRGNCCRKTPPRDGQAHPPSDGSDSLPLFAEGAAHEKNTCSGMRRHAPQSQGSCTHLLQTSVGAVALGFLVGRMKIDSVIALKVLGRHFFKRPLPTLFPPRLPASAGLPPLSSRLSRSGTSLLPSWGTLSGPVVLLGRSAWARGGLVSSSLSGSVVSLLPRSCTHFLIISSVLALRLGGRFSACTALEMTISWLSSFRIPGKNLSHYNIWT